MKYYKARDTDSPEYDTLLVVSDEGKVYPFVLEGYEEKIADFESGNDDVSNYGTTGTFPCTTWTITEEITL